MYLLMVHGVHSRNFRTLPPSRSMARIADRLPCKTPQDANAHVGTKNCGLYRRSDDDEADVSVVLNRQSQQTRREILPKTTGGRYIADFLHAYGVTAIFFVPTVLSRTLASMDDLPIKRVLTHGEKAAAYMADGYARACSRPGVCAAQAIGGTNLAAGLRDAFLGHSPVITFTGGRLPHQKHKHNYQEIDDYPIFSQVTKANFYVDVIGRLPDIMRQAFREATSGTPGTVNLMLAGKETDIETHEAYLELLVEMQHICVPAHRPLPDKDRIEQALQWLRTAERPVMVVGGGAKWSGARAELLQFSESQSIPVATSLNALALFPEHHPLYIGVPGTYSRSCTNKILSRADLVLYVGSQTGGQVSHFWNVPPQGTRVIQIGIDPSDLGRNYSSPVSLLGDAKVTLHALMGETHSRPGWQEEVESRWMSGARKSRLFVSLMPRPCGQSVFSRNSVTGFRTMLSSSVIRDTQACGLRSSSGSAVCAGIVFVLPARWDGHFPLPLVRSVQCHIDR